jgi:signal transduction histidine kinase
MARTLQTTSMISLIAFIVLGFAHSACAFVCQADIALLPPVLSSSGFRAKSSQLYELSSWKFRPGDNPEWALPEFDDSEWTQTRSRQMPADFPGGKWDGIGWFRTTINTDASAAEVPFALSLALNGAAEVYFNGVLVFSIGKVGASAESERITVNNLLSPYRLPAFTGEVQHLAVRYSLWDADRYVKGSRLFGFKALLGRAPEMYRMSALEIHDLYRLQYIITTLAVVFGLFHLLLYLFHRSNKGNLYYSLLAFSLSVLLWCTFTFESLSQHNTYFVILTLFRVTIIMTCLTGMRFAYSILESKPPVQFFVALAVGALMMLGVVYMPLTWIYVFCFLTMIEAVRVFILAWLRRRPGAWVVGIGMIVFTILTSFEILRDLHVAPFTQVTSHYLFVYGVVVLVGSMSVYLSWQVARTYKNLEQQLLQVKSLSETTLRQERTVKEHEMRQKLLEAENLRKEQEIEESRKLRKVLDELEATNLNLRKTQAQLVHSEKMATMGMLIAGVAHEINTPVGAMSSMHGTLIKAIDKLKMLLGTACADKLDQNDPQLLSTLALIDDANRVISTGTSRVTNIVRRLRSFARLDEAERTTANIHDGIEDTLTLIHHEIKHSIVVKKNFGDIPEIICYPGQLNQVFLNLLVNSRQAMEQGGTITITTALENDNIRIDFADTGKGIPPENLEKIFDPGFTTKGVGVGTGLGLSIVDSIIQAHGGSISVQSEVGKGTTFTILLPVVSPESESQSMSKK